MDFRPTLASAFLVGLAACAPGEDDERCVPSDAEAPLDPLWPHGVRMIDIELHEDYPARARDIANDAAEISCAIDEAADVGASVVQLHFADEFLYADWIDEDGFATNLATLADAAAHAHDRGLHVLVYMNGLEVMTPGAADDPSIPSMAREHPEWLQTTHKGDRIAFLAPDPEVVDYLQGDDWEDAWLCPLTGYRELFLARARDVVAAGADGIFVDVAYLPGLPELVPELLEDESAIEPGDELLNSCFDPACRTAFAERNPELAMPVGAERLDFAEPSARALVRFRYDVIREYYADMLATVRAVDPAAVVLAETSANDVPINALTFGNDNLLTPITVTPELVPPYEDLDEDEVGPDAYVDLFAMLKYAQAGNRSHGVPLVPLGAAENASDRDIQAAMMIATAGSYFTFDVEWSDLAPHFSFIADHADDLVDTRPGGVVAVVFSAASRDYADGFVGEAYEPVGPHFGTYRRVQHVLADAHVPYDVVLVEDAAVALERYAAVVVPGVRCLSEGAAARLAAVPGALVVVGDIGGCDLEGAPAPIPELGGTALPADVEGTLLLDALGDAGARVRVDTEAPVIVEAATTRDGAIAVHVVGLAGVPDELETIVDVRITVAATDPMPTRARLLRPGHDDATLVPEPVDGGASVVIDAFTSYAVVVFD